MFIYYTLDICKAVYLRRGIPFQVLHHVGTMLGGYAVLLTPPALYRCTLLLVGFEVSTLFLNLSSRWHYFKLLFILSTAYCRVYLLVTTLVATYTYFDALRRIYVIIAVSCIVIHNLAYVYVSYLTKATHDVSRLFG